MEFETVSDLLQHQLDLCPGLMSDSIVETQHQHSNSENSSFAWSSGILPSPNATDNPQSNSTSFSSTSSVSSHSPPQTNNPTSNVNVSPSETSNPESTLNLMNIYSKYVLGSETEKEEVDKLHEVNDLFGEEMSAKDLLDSLVNLLQVMGNKLVEKDAEILTLQADREYLRDENTRCKNKLKQQKQEQSGNNQRQPKPQLSPHNQHESSSPRTSPAQKSRKNQPTPLKQAEPHQDREQHNEEGEYDEEGIQHHLDPESHCDETLSPQSETEAPESQSSSDNSNIQVLPGNSSYADITRNGKRVAIISDSMCKHIKLDALNRSLENKTAYKKIFLGATPADISHYCVRTLEEDSPDIAILHAGTNSIGKVDPFVIAKDLMKCVERCKSQGCSTVFVSGIVDRPDFSTEVSTLNNILFHWSFLHGYTFIYNENIRYDCLARDGLHLNHRGVLRLGANFRRALNKPYV